MSYRMVCPECSIDMKIDALGVYVLETMGNPPTPYKLWAADLLVCPNCKKRVIARFGNGPIAEHYQDGFAAKLEVFKPLYYSDERAGLRLRAATNKRS